MEAWAWNFFISSLFSVLAKHSCQGPPDRPGNTAESLSPAAVLSPAASSSGISYESLHYPGPVDQYDDVIPVVISTGKIPLVNHAVQAPKQYFVPNNGESTGRAPTTYDSSSAQRSPTHRQHQPLRGDPDTTIRSSLSSSHRRNDAENRRQSYDGNDYHHNNAPATTAVYSKTGVEGQRQRHTGYGYKIIDDNLHVGRRDAAQVVGPTSHRDNSRSSSSSSGPEETKRDFEHTTVPARAKLLQLPREAAGGQQPADKSDDPRHADNSARAFKPIVVETVPSTTKIELKKYYKKTTSPETPTEVTNKNRKFAKI